MSMNKFRIVYPTHKIKHVGCWFEVTWPKNMCTLLDGRPHILLASAIKSGEILRLVNKFHLNKSKISAALDIPICAIK